MFGTSGKLGLGGLVTATTLRDVSTAHSKGRIRWMYHSDGSDKTLPPEITPPHIAP